MTTSPGGIVCGDWQWEEIACWCWNFVIDRDTQWQYWYCSLIIEYCYHSHSVLMTCWGVTVVIQWCRYWRYPVYALSYWCHITFRWCDPWLMWQGANACDCYWRWFHSRDDVLLWWWWYDDVGCIVVIDDKFSSLSVILWLYSGEEMMIWRWPVIWNENLFWSIYYCYCWRIINTMLLLWRGQFREEIVMTLDMTLLWLIITNDDIWL